VRKTRMQWAVSLVSVVAAGVAAFSGAPSASGQSSANGELGAGGTALGDISTAAGEEDRIGIDLVSGSSLAAKLVAGFNSDIVLLDPSDAPSAATFGAAAPRTLAAWTVTTTGKYHFRIRSADGTQGTYTLTAAVKWPAKVTVTGTSGGSAAIALPAGATVKAIVSSVPAAGWNPSVTAFMAPGGINLLAAPVAGAKGVALLKPVKTTAAGVHSIAVGGGAAGAQFQAAFTVKAAKVNPVRIDLRNGLTSVGFAAAGIGQMMKTYNCVACHAWASSYAGVKANALLAVPRLQIGQMPLGGPPLPASAVSLFQQWVNTGMKP
jgi:hypothetical protein